jgi:general secretion pathway protein K
VTLAVLLWFLAALSILAAGIAYQARLNIKLSQLQLERARVAAAADGAIQLTLAEMQVAQQTGEVVDPGQFVRGYQLGGLPVQVSVVPVGGLVSLNSAPVELLASLFAGIGPVTPAAAEELARNVVDWRSPSYAAAGEGASAMLRGGRFQAIEDLLAVRGINRDMYERLRDLVYVAQQEADGVDWLSAPLQVITALGGVDRARALDIIESRRAGSLGTVALPQDIDTTFQASGPAATFRIDAVVELGGAQYLRRRWADTTRPGADGFPWHFFRTEPVRAPGSWHLAASPGGGG